LKVTQSLRIDSFTGRINIPLRNGQNATNPNGGNDMSGKGSKPRPLAVNHKTFSENWDKIFESENPLERPFDMWRHECPKERIVLNVEKGKACNWCGQFEDGSFD